MGRITTGGLYAPSILGVLQGAVSATDTTFSVSVAQAVEIDRRIGQTGTLTLVGPPTAGGTVATFTETFTVVDTTTGAITCSALDADLIAGSFVGHNDGSQIPRTFIDDSFGEKVTDVDGTSIDVQFPLLPLTGIIDSSQILPVWPSDTSLQQWIVDQLNAYGEYQFDHQF